MLLTDKLTAIGDAVRAKTGTEDPMTLDEMATAIEGITTGSVDIPEDLLVLTGDQSYKFYGGKWDGFVETYGHLITTNDLLSGEKMFEKTKLETIPFSINFKEDDKGLLSMSALNNLFSQAINLTQLPEINIYTVPSYGFNNTFSGCQNLRYIDLDFENMDWDTKWSSYSYAYMGYWGDNCYSLRAIPKTIWHKVQTKKTVSTTTTYSPYYRLGYSAYNLDELCDLPVIGSYTSNCFSFQNCYRLKDFIFQVQDNGDVYAVNWKNQTINLSTCGFEKIQYSHYTRDKSLYNSGITIDKCIYDDETYQALKDDPDNYVAGYATENPHYYSRYDKASALRTINSLPDVSASGGTNTIKFKGEAGLKTDNGAINTMTEEEIAVATAKGWTVSFA